jgi:hypothetical protein
LKVTKVNAKVVVPVPRGVVLVVEEEVEVKKLTK